MTHLDDDNEYDDENAQPSFSSSCADAIFDVFIGLMLGTVIPFVLLSIFWKEKTRKGMWKIVLLAVLTISCLIAPFFCFLWQISAYYELNSIVVCLGVYYMPWIAFSIWNRLSGADVNLQKYILHDPDDEPEA